MSGILGIRGQTAAVFLPLYTALSLCIVVLGCSEERNRSTTSDRGIRSESSDSSTPTFELDFIRSYGWLEMAEADRALSDSERHAGAGVIAQPVDLAEGPDGAVYILDRLHRKVVVFEEDGALRQVIDVASAQLPEPLRVPGSLALDNDGSILVLDSLDHWLVQFNVAGEHISTTRVPTYRPGLLRITPRGVWVSRSSARAPYMPMVLLDRSTGRLADSILELKAVDVRRPPVAGQLDRGRTNDILFQMPTPSRWVEVTSSGAPSEVLGMFRSPPPGGGSIKADVIVPRGIGILPDGRVVLLYAMRTEHETPMSTTESDIAWIDIFSPNREYLGSAPVPQGEAYGRMLVLGNGDILLTTHENHPGAARFVITGG